MKTFEDIDLCKQTENSNNKSNTTKSNEYHLIILNSGNTVITDDLKELCAKGPSFVPTP